jgi:hypothetical protein
MKKLFSFILILVVISPLFSQKAEGNITDYFPVEIGNIWTYTNGTEKLNITVFVQNSSQTDIPVYLFVEQTAGLGQTSTMYGLENNKIVIMAIKNIVNQYKENRRPFPVQLAPANQNWRQNESSEEYYLFKTTKSSIKYNDKVFDDCILVEQQTYLNGKLFVTKRSYYAKNIGLVYVTIQGAGEQERCFQKLISCNFFDIKNANVNDEISKLTKTILGTWVESWNNDWHSFTFYDDGTFYDRNIITYIDEYTKKTKFGNVYPSKGNYKFIGKNKVQLEWEYTTSIYDFKYDNNTLYLKNEKFSWNLQRDILSKESIKGKRYILIDEKEWQEEVGTIFFSIDGIMVITSNNTKIETKKYIIEDNLIKTNDSILWFYVAPDGIIIDNGTDSGPMYYQQDTRNGEK